MPTDSVSHATGGGYPSPQYQEFLRALGRRWSCIPVLIRPDDPKKDKQPDFRLLESATGTRRWGRFKRERPNLREAEAWREAEGFAVVTGPVSGNVCVLDVDPRHGGTGSLEGRPLPPTPVAKTWSAKSRAHGEPGLHYYFQGDGTERPGKDLLPGVELLARGQYAVLPGPEGREWVISPDDQDLAPLPDWLRELARTARDTTKAPAGPSPDLASQSSKSTYRADLLTDLLGSPPEGGQGGRGARIGVSAPGELADFYRREDVALAVAPVLGIKVRRLGEAFRCVLHEEENASASLYSDAQGVVKYHDFHGRGSPEWFTLPDVRASLAYGQPVHLRGPELATWGRRLLVEAGIVAPAPVDHVELPDDAPPHARALYDGLILLLACKWAWNPGEPTAYSWRFATAWAGLSSQWQVGDGMKWLLRRGYVRQVGAHPGPYGHTIALFLPGDEDLVRRRSSA